MELSNDNTRPSNRQIQLQAQEYMDSYPGRSSVPSNMAVHASFNRCIGKPDTLTDKYWDMVWKRLCYRRAMMHLAEQILIKNAIEYTVPWHWEDDAWMITKSQDEYLYLRFSAIMKYISAAGLFPYQKPSIYELYGFKWLKPQRYLAAALAESRLELDKIELLLQKAGQGGNFFITTGEEDVKPNDNETYQKSSWWASMRERACAWLLSCFRTTSSLSLTRTQEKKRP